MKSFIILLRGVTPAGNNKVPMAALREALSEAGLRNVKTYIQSGNVLAFSNLGQSGIEKLVHDVIRKKFGGDITVIARTPEQLQNILKRDPFPHADKSKQYYTILESRPGQGLIKELMSIDFSPDEVRIAGDVIYTLYETKLSDSKFNNNFYERKLKVAATTRNYNTMSALAELSSVT